MKTIEILFTYIEKTHDPPIWLCVFLFIKYLIMKRYDVVVIIIIESGMLIVWVWMWTNIAQEQQQAITKETCIEFFNSL